MNNKILTNIKVPELLALAFLIASFLFPLYYFDQLPDQIPIHFNAKGEPDAYGGKVSIWILPIIGMATYLLLHFASLSKNLRINEFGQKKKLSPKEKAYKERIGKQLILILKVIVPGFICYIIYQSIQIALEKVEGLGVYSLIVFLIILFGLIGYYMYKMSNPPN